MYQQQRLQGVADLLANQGRYGDSMLVHMNPVEVQGLASMSPTGSLTVNPETGQPEAFLPFLAPLLGSMLGSSALTGATLGGLVSGGLSSAAAGAIGSGLASWAATGDLKQGLVSGITGFGIGHALGGAGGAVPEEALVKAGEEAAKGAVQGYDPTGLAATIGQEVPEAVIQQAKEAGIQQALGPFQQFEGIASDAGFGERLGTAFSGEGLDVLATPEALIPMGIAEDYNAQRLADEAMEKWDKSSGMMSEAELARQEEAIIANSFPNISLGPRPPRPLGDDYGAQYINTGGIVSLDPDDYRRRVNGLQELIRPTVRMQAGGGVPYMGGFGLLPGGAALGRPGDDQAALRDPHVITPWQLQDAYAQQGLPGFGPELKYFTTEEEGVLTDPNPWWRERPEPPPPPDPNAPPPEDDEDDGGDIQLPGLNDRLEALRQLQAGEITWEEYIARIGEIGRASAGTGTDELETTTEVPETTTPIDGSGLSAEEIADLYGKYMNYGSNFNFGSFGMQAGGGIGDFMNAGAMPMQESVGPQENAEADRLIDLAAMAVLGELPEEEADVVIQAFIDEFGEEAFSSLREAVLEGVVPGSQKEGEIVGPGGGMDDQVAGMIGNQQPVAVSPGEYIVPSDVVSGIGDGSTDAGVQELDGMLDRVRTERTGTTQQPPPLRGGGVLPR